MKMKKTLFIWLMTCSCLTYSPYCKISKMERIIKATHPSLMPGCTFKNKAYQRVSYDWGGFKCVTDFSHHESISPFLQFRSFPFSENGMTGTLQTSRMPLDYKTKYKYMDVVSIGIGLEIIKYSLLLSSEKTSKLHIIGKSLLVVNWNQWMNVVNTELDFRPLRPPPTPCSSLIQE